MSGPLRVSFVFASRGIGGAERSMLRVMQRAHPQMFACRVLAPARENRQLREAVTALGVPYHALPASDVLGLWRLLRLEQPDVLYVFGRFRSLVWAAVARLAGVRCIVAAERSAANRWSDRLARRLDRFLVTAYVANSSAAARNLKAIVGRGGPPVWVVPNGVRWDDGAPRAAKRSEPASLLCVGNITPNKGQGVLLEAVRLLRASHPGLRATLVGRDFTEGRFFSEAEKRGLADTYTAVGFAEDVRPHLARATLVVLPTLLREGMPASLLEAMSAGVPIVASRTGGVDEIVRDEETGLLVTPGDARGLARSISRLLDDASLRERLAGNARRYVRERHDLSVMLDGHLAAFHEALRIARGAREAGSAVSPGSAT